MEAQNVYLADYLQYNSVQRWLRQLKKKATKYDSNAQIPADTLKSVKYALDRFTQYTGLNPDELIDEARCQNRTVGDTLAINDRIDSFWSDIQTAPDASNPKWIQTTATVAGLLFGMICAFYGCNMGTRLKIDQPGIPTVRTKELVPSSEIVRRHCDVAPIQHASWILVNNYLGLRIGGIPQLTVDDFHIENWTHNQPLYPVYISRRITGLPWELQLYIGYDAMTKLATYIQRNNLKGSDRVWKYSVNYLIRMFKKYAYQAGIVDAPSGLDEFGAPKGLCPYHIHCLRKRRQTIQESVKTNGNWVDYMMQHIPKGADAANYSRPSDAELYQETLAALPQLEIYGHHDQSPTKPTVQLQRMIISEQLKTLDIDSDKKQQIENLLKNVRLEVEMKDAVAGTQNVMKIAKLMEE
jgi:hypothetical protein